MSGNNKVTVTGTITLLLSLTLLTTATVQGACAEQLAPAAPTFGSVFHEAETPAPLSSALEQRIKHEKRSNSLRFSILPHQTNYLLPGAYNSSPNNGVYAGITDGGEHLDNLEAKFQLSIKTPLWENIFGDNGTLYAAYSQLAFWQAYNSSASSPFREINFEPEAFIAFNSGYKLLGVTNQVVSVGFNHQSNGRGKPLSRSWNRIIANLVFSTGDTYVSLKPWLRIPEKAWEDDNPGMDKYYGYGELFILQKVQEHSLGLMLRNNLRSSDNKGAVQADWSFPLHKKLRGYIQYFNGYGESLIDYDHANNRIGVGVMLTDWL